MFNNKPVLASHSVTKIPPEPSVPGYYKLIPLRWHLTTLKCVDNMGIVQTEDNGIINLTSRGSVPTASVSHKHAHIYIYTYTIVYYSNFNLIILCTRQFPFAMRHL